MEKNKILNIAIIVAIVLLFAIIAIAVTNFFTINRCIQKTIASTENTIAKTDSIVRIQTGLDSIQKETLKRQERMFSRYLEEIRELKKGVFDSNTITFMSSFLLVIIVGVLLGIEKDAREKIDKAKEEIEAAKSQYNLAKGEIDVAKGKIDEAKVDISTADEMIKQALLKYSEAKNQFENAKTGISDFQKQMQIRQDTAVLNTQVQSLQIVSIHVQSVLAKNNYVINEEIIMLLRELHNNAEDLLKELEGIIITTSGKGIFDGIFERMIYAFEENKIVSQPENEGKTNTLIATIAKLRELQNKIMNINVMA